MFIILKLKYIKVLILIYFYYFVLYVIILCVRNDDFFKYVYLDRIYGLFKKIKGDFNLIFIGRIILLYGVGGWI